MLSSLLNGKSLEERMNESLRVRTRNPARIPIILSRGNSNVREIGRNKYLVPLDMTMGQLAFVIRRKIEMTPEKALFLFVNNKLLPTNALMEQVYQIEQNEDGFLYIFYSSEDTFGAANQKGLIGVKVP